MNLNTYNVELEELATDKDNILVSGNNPEGRHGKGVALVAHQHFGMTYGVARGLINRSFGIVTKDLRAKTHPSIPVHDIMKEINDLYTCAKENPTKRFYVPYTGYGANLSGFSAADFAKMFYRPEIPSNVYFKECFAELMEDLFGE